MWGSFYSWFWNTIKTQKEIRFQSLSGSSHLFFLSTKDRFASLGARGRYDSCELTEKLHGAGKEENLKARLWDASQLHSQISEGHPDQAPASLWTLVVSMLQPSRARAHRPWATDASSALCYKKQAGPRPTKSISIYQSTDGLSDTASLVLWIEARRIRPLDNMAQLEGLPGVVGN